MQGGFDLCRDPVVAPEVEDLAAALAEAGADSVAAEATEEAVASIEVHASTEDTAMAHVLASVRVFTVVEDALAACLVC